jgi:hypothetical protein
MSRHALLRGTFLFHAATLTAFFKIISLFVRFEHIAIGIG